MKPNALTTSYLLHFYCGGKLIPSLLPPVKYPWGIHLPNDVFHSFNISSTITRLVSRQPPFTLPVIKYLHSSTKAIKTRYISYDWVYFHQLQSSAWSLGHTSSSNDDCTLVRLLCCRWIQKKPSLKSRLRQLVSEFFRKLSNHSSFVSTNNIYRCRRPSAD